jgi:hypothetical protein
MLLGVRCRTHWIRVSLRRDALGSGVSWRQDALGSALDPGFHYARTHWIRGFSAFQLARRTRTVMLMVPACPESGFLSEDRRYVAKLARYVMSRRGPTVPSAGMPCQTLRMLSSLMTRETAVKRCVWSYERSRSPQPGSGKLAQIDIMQE